MRTTFILIILVAFIGTSSKAQKSEFKSDIHKQDLEFRAVAEIGFVDL